MSLENVFLLFGSLFCLLSGFIGFNYLSRHTLPKPLSAIIIYALILAVSGSFGIFDWHNNDFISPSSALAFLMPLLAALPIAALIFFPLNLIFRWLISFSLASFVLICFNIETILFSNLPLWSNQLIVAFLWSIVATGLRVLNGEPTLVVSEILCSGLGIFILSYDVSYGNRKYRWNVCRQNLIEESNQFKQIQIDNFRMARSRRRKKV